MPASGPKWSDLDASTRPLPKCRMVAVAVAPSPLCLSASQSGSSYVVARRINSRSLKGCSGAFSRSAKSADDIHSKTGQIPADFCRYVNSHSKNFRASYEHQHPQRRLKPARDLEPVRAIAPSSDLGELAPGAVRTVGHSRRWTRTLLSYTPFRLPRLVASFWIRRLLPADDEICVPIGSDRPTAAGQYFEERTLSRSG